MQPRDLDTSSSYGMLAPRLERLTLGLLDGPSAIPSLFFFRREAVSRPVVCLVEPSALFVVQGEKEMLVGEKCFPYGVGKFLLTSLDLPANSRVVEASPERPVRGRPAATGLPHRLGAPVPRRCRTKPGGTANPRHGGRHSHAPVAGPSVSVDPTSRRARCIGDPVPFDSARNSLPHPPERPGSSFVADRFRRQPRTAHCQGDRLVEIELRQTLEGGGTSRRSRP